jgi:integrase
VTRLSGGPPRAKGHGGPPTDGAGRLQLRASVSSSLLLRRSADIDETMEQASPKVRHNGSRSQTNRTPTAPVQTGHFDKLFRKAKRDVGLSHIHFHDSRREAATTLAPKLSNVLELAAITGHKSLSMLQVYYKPKAADLAPRLDT